jgi:hypothetical protein
MHPYSWVKDENLSWSLIAAITEDPDIKQGLFPSPGANSSSAKGGGKTKTEWHWRLCDVLFSQHPDYAAAFSLAKNATGKPAAKQRANWANKIKNRIKV